MRFTPSPHTDRSCLLAVTGRVPLELAHDALIVAEGLHLVSNDESTFHPPASCTGDCEWGCDCTCSHALAWRAPRQPRRSLPTLSLWRRLVLALQRLRYSFR